MRLINADLVVSKLQAVLDGKANEKESTAYFAFRAFIDLIDTEPTIDPATLAPRWRDAKTNPPKEDGKYFCICGTQHCILRFTNKAEEDDDLAYIGAKGKAWYFYDSEWGNCKVDDVTFWQPLPEPPKEG